MYTHYIPNNIFYIQQLHVITDYRQAYIHPKHQLNINQSISFIG